MSAALAPDLAARLLGGRAWAARAGLPAPGAELDAGDDELGLVALVQLPGDAMPGSAPLPLFPWRAYQRAGVRLQRGEYRRECGREARYRASEALRLARRRGLRLAALRSAGQALLSLVRLPAL